MKKIYHKIKSLLKYGIKRYLKTKFSLVKIKLDLRELQIGRGGFVDDISLVFPSKINYGKPPIFFNQPNYIDIDAYDGRSISPDVYLYRLKSVSVIARTEFIIHEDTAFYPPVINPECDVFMAEIEGHAKIDFDQDIINISLIKKIVHVNRAISLFGQANGNYLHFLTETLTRLSLINRLSHLNDVVILIEDNLHPRFYEAVDLLNVNDYPVKRISPYTQVSVNDLYYISPISYTSPETRKLFQDGELDEPRMEQFIFSTDGLKCLREQASSVSGNYIVNPRQFNHRIENEFVYLERNLVNTGNGRLLLNQSSLTSILSTRGFNIIDSGYLNFSEQVSFLRHSELIVAPVGASLGNLIFCENSAKVVLVSPVYRGATFFYFSNLLSTLGHEIIFVLGKQSNESGIGLQEKYNRNFTAPVNLVIDAVDLFVNNLLHNQ